MTFDNCSWWSSWRTRAVSFPGMLSSSRSRCSGCSSVSDGQCKSRLYTCRHIVTTGRGSYVIGPAGSNMCRSIVWKKYGAGVEPKLKIWPSVFQLCVWERRRTVSGRVSQVHHSFSHMRGHTCFLFFFLSPSVLCAVLFSVTIITALLQMIKEIAEFHQRAFCILTGRGPSQVKKEKHAIFERRVCEGAAVLICACVKREGESGPLSGRKGWSSVMELRSPSILIKNT